MAVVAPLVARPAPLKQRRLAALPAIPVVHSPRWVRTVFSADLRSLAVFRIVLALVVLLDLADRSRNLTAHYTDAGVMPRADLLAHRDILDSTSFSINLISGGAFVQGVIFVIAALAAVGLLVGYVTRLMTLIVWLLVVSIEWRNPLLNGGGEGLLRLLLFWSLFLPLGAMWSVDRRRDRGPPPASMRVASVPVAALFLQYAFVYWFAFLLKSSPEWRSEGTALSRALGLEEFAKPLAHTLLQFPSLLMVMTFGVLAIEGLGPFLLLSPFKTGPLRTLGVALFMSLHLGIWLTLGMGIFPAVAGLTMVCFLPTWFWDRVARLRGRPPRAADPRGAVIPPPSRAISAAVAVLIAFVLLWNLTTVTSLTMPSALHHAGVYLGLGQKWDMFAPHPLDDDGWYVVPATLKDGRVVDLAAVLRGENKAQPLTWRKPRDLRGSYGGERWRKYLENLRLHHPDQHLYLSRYICREWNRGRAAAQQVDSLMVGFMGQRILSDGGHTTPALRTLWVHRCGA